MMDKKSEFNQRAIRKITPFNAVVKKIMIHVVKKNVDERYIAFKYHKLKFLPNEKSSGFFFINKLHNYNITLMSFPFSLCGECVFSIKYA